MSSMNAETDTETCVSISSSRPQSLPWTRLVASACSFELFILSVSFIPTFVTGGNARTEARLRGWQDQVLEPLVVRLGIEIEIVPHCESQTRFPRRVSFSSDSKGLSDSCCFPPTDSSSISSRTSMLYASLCMTAGSSTILSMRSEATPALQVFRHFSGGRGATLLRYHVRRLLRNMGVHGGLNVLRAAHLEPK